MSSEERNIKRSGDWEPGIRYLLAAPNRKEAERRFELLHGRFLAAINQTLSEEIGGNMPASIQELNDETDIFNDISLLVRGKIAKRLLNLWEVRHSQDASSKTNRIHNLSAYVAAAARNACVDYLRQEYPGRHALDNALRAALAVRTDLALWRATLSEGQSEWRCGPPEWQADEKTPVSLHISSDLRSQLAVALEGVNRGGTLSRVFESASAPLRYQELLGFLADYWHVESSYRFAEQNYAPFRVPKSYQEGLQPEAVVEIMGALQSFWHYVKKLSPEQAAVLLLKLPSAEGGSYLDVMARLQVASWSELSDVVGLAVHRLRELSSHVPLEDQEIAEVIGISPADVPRIRQDARRRLKRLQKRSQER